MTPKIAVVRAAAMMANPKVVWLAPAVLGPWVDVGLGVEAGAEDGAVVGPVVGADVVTAAPVGVLLAEGADEDTGLV